MRKDRLNNLQKRVGTKQAVQPDLSQVSTESLERLLYLHNKRKTDVIHLGQAEEIMLSNLPASLKEPDVSNHLERLMTDEEKKEFQSLTRLQKLAL